MRIALRIFANFACLLGALWLSCASYPLLSLIAMRVHGTAQIVTFAVIGSLDLAVITLLFIVANVYISRNGVLYG